jgi:2-polyprenyl-3-methyl-5-hydroxy-6-metoxy-1,4-benzoquinol methylase
MAADGWNRNNHYHGLVLKAIPESCRRALDVGCGTGLLARRLAEHCEEVVGIDVHAATLSHAIAATGRDSRVSFVKGDVMTHALEPASFDTVTAIATLHHLPLEPALLRFRELLRPDGVLVVIGLYRLRTPADFAFGVAGKLAGWWLRWRNDYEEVAAPIHEPEETLCEIQAAVRELLPGAVVNRLLLFRDSLIWRKPGGRSS